MSSKHKKLSSLDKAYMVYMLSIPTYKADKLKDKSLTILNNAIENSSSVQDMTALLDNLFNTVVVEKKTILKSYRQQANKGKSKFIFPVFSNDTDIKICNELKRNNINKKITPSIFSKNSIKHKTYVEAIQLNSIEFNNDFCTKYKDDDKKLSRLHQIAFNDEKEVNKVIIKIGFAYRHDIKPSVIAELVRAKKDYKALKVSLYEELSKPKYKNLFLLKKSLPGIVADYRDRGLIENDIKNIILNHIKSIDVELYINLKKAWSE